MNLLSWNFDDILNNILTNNDHNMLCNDICYSYFVIIQNILIAET